MIQRLYRIYRQTIGERRAKLHLFERVVLIECPTSNVASTENRQRTFENLFVEWFEATPDLPEIIFKTFTLGIEREIKSEINELASMRKDRNSNLFVQLKLFSSLVESSYNARKIGWYTRAIMDHYVSGNTRSESTTTP